MQAASLTIAQPQTQPQWPPVTSASPRRSQVTVTSQVLPSPREAKTSAPVPRDPVTAALVAQCRDNALQKLGFPLSTPPMNTLVDEVVETTVDVVLAVVHELVKDGGGLFTPPPTLHVTCDAGGEPVRFAGCGRELCRGRAGDLWEIMKVLADNPQKPLTVKQVQRAVDGAPVPVREKVVRTRIAELARRFPGSILAKTQPGKRHKQYRFVAEIVEAPLPS